MTDVRLGDVVADEEHHGLHRLTQRAGNGASPIAADRQPDDHEDEERGQHEEDEVLGRKPQEGLVRHVVHDHLGRTTVAVFPFGVVTRCVGARCVVRFPGLGLVIRAGVGTLRPCVLRVLGRSRRLAGDVCRGWALRLSGHDRQNQRQHERQDQEDPAGRGRPGVCRWRMASSMTRKSTK